MMPWFDVDKQGLAKLLERKGKAFAVFELIQNAWDTSATDVGVSLTPVPGRPEVLLVVRDDDPEGFQSLTHAWTLFAESGKKGQADKRGRFNLGEKLVLALCEDAEIKTTTGTVVFDRDGRHVFKQRRTEVGSIFSGHLRMTRTELAEIGAAVQTLIPPPGVCTMFNDEPLAPRPMLRCFDVSLPTEIADDDGVLRRTVRKTAVRVHEVRQGETAMIYEMGIPVVETGDQWHVDIGQKVPLNLDRDNVAPAYLRAVRVAVLNEMHELVRGATARAPWVREALSDERAAPAAVEHVITERFGPKRVIADPNDPEGTKIAMSRGYTVIHSGSLSAGEWDNVRATGAVLPAGQVTPSPKPYDPDGRPLKLATELTPGMVRMQRFAADLGRCLLGAKVEVQIADDSGLKALATYGPRDEGRAGWLVLNAARLGSHPSGWFNRRKRDPEVLSLLIHEFAHHTVRDHLSSEFHEACCKLGAVLANTALCDPELFAETP